MRTGSAMFNDDPAEIPGQFPLLFPEDDQCPEVHPLSGVRCLLPRWHMGPHREF